MGMNSNDDPSVEEKEEEEVLEKEVDEEEEDEDDEDNEDDLEGYYSDTPLNPKPNYPPLNQNFDTMIIIMNLPRVPPSKVDKLMNFLIKKLVGRIGPLATDDEGDGEYTGVYMPMNEDTGTTYGCAYVEYENREDAAKAVDVLEGYSFDKNHILKVIGVGRALALETVESTFREPAPAPFVAKPNTSSFLEDNAQRDQFVVRQGNETIVHWSDAKTEPVVDYDGSREKAAGTVWCEYYVHWSPKGSYLATLVPAKGVILWGGPNYEKIARFPSPGVQFVVFSPCETYLLTNNNDKNDEAAIKVFRVGTGQKLREFPLFPKDSTGDIPPPFLWSHDDAYLARMGVDLISIYESSTMKLLDRRSHSAKGIREFQWSPTANILAFWCPEVGNSPAHVDLVEIPSRKQLRQKNLFNVTQCSMVWQNMGEYLSVKVTRHTKSKKTLYNNIELFRMNEAGIPVEMLDTKDAVTAFAWEPCGSRFGMIHAENPTATKVTVSFYNMLKEDDSINNNTITNTTSKKNKNAATTTVRQELCLETKLEQKQCNCLFWSPAGSVILLAGLGDSASGTLEFYDADQHKVIATRDHYRANAVLWDPSGRTVATTVSQPIEGGHFKFAMDNGFVLWTFQGRQLYQTSYEHFYQFLWRPRPDDLLTPAKKRAIVKDMRKYEKIFDRADRERTRALRLEETKEKRRERREFRHKVQYLQQCRRRQRAQHIQLLNGYDSEDESHYVTKEKTLETIVSSKEEVVF